MTLTLKIAIQYSCTTLWHMVMYHHDKLRKSSVVQKILSAHFLWPWPWNIGHGLWRSTISASFFCKRIISSEDNAETVTLKIATIFCLFCIIFWLLVMPHHTKSGRKKKLSGFEDIFWKKPRHMERETGGQDRGTDRHSDSSVTPPASTPNFVMGIQ